MIDLRLGDCLAILPSLEGIDAVLTDPPYGIDHDTDYTRFSKAGKKRGGGQFAPIVGDKLAFDPSPWLAYPKVILFGSNCFSDRLPAGSLLVWCKKHPNKLGKFMGDCEVAWKKGGLGFNFVGIECDPGYYEIARRRIEAASLAGVA